MCTESISRTQFDTGVRIHQRQRCPLSLDQQSLLGMAEEMPSSTNSNSGYDDTNQSDDGSLDAMPSFKLLQDRDDGTNNQQSGSSGVTSGETQNFGGCRCHCKDKANCKHACCKRHLNSSSQQLHRDSKGSNTPGQFTATAKYSNDPRTPPEDSIFTHIRKKSKSLPTVNWPIRTSSACSPTSGSDVTSFSLSPQIPSFNQRSHSNNNEMNGPINQDTELYSFSGSYHSAGDSETMQPPLDQTSLTSPISHVKSSSGTTQVSIGSARQQRHYNSSVNPQQVCKSSGHGYSLSNSCENVSSDRFSTVPTTRTSNRQLHSSASLGKDLDQEMVQVGNTKGLSSLAQERNHIPSTQLPGRNLPPLPSRRGERVYGTQSYQQFGKPLTSNLVQGKTTSENLSGPMISQTSNSSSLYQRMVESFHGESLYNQVDNNMDESSENRKQGEENDETYNTSWMAGSYPDLMSKKDEAISRINGPPEQSPPHWAADSEEEPVCSLFDSLLYPESPNLKAGTASDSFLSTRRDVGTPKCSALPFLSSEKPGIASESASFSSLGPPFGKTMQFNNGATSSIGKGRYMGSKLLKDEGMTVLCGIPNGLENEKLNRNSTQGSARISSQMSSQMSRMPGDHCMSNKYDNDDSTITRLNTTVNLQDETENNMVKENDKDDFTSTKLNMAVELHDNQSSTGDVESIFSFL